MQLLAIVCYTLSTCCFLFSIFRHKLAPTTLDFMAMGLFFAITPTLVEQFALLV